MTTEIKYQKEPMPKSLKIALVNHKNALGKLEVERKKFEAAKEKLRVAENAEYIAAKDLELQEYCNSHWIKANAIAAVESQS